MGSTKELIGQAGRLDSEGGPHRISDAISDQQETREATLEIAGAVVARDGEPLEALDTFIAGNASMVQAQHAAASFDVHRVLQAMDNEPRPPQGDAGLMRLPVVDMQGRPLTREPELRYSAFHRLTSGAVKVVAVQLKGTVTGAMLSRTFAVEGVPYRMDLFGGSKLKPPKKPLNQLASELPSATSEAPSGKLLAIPYAETAPGTAFEQLSRAWAPFKEAYYYTQRRGFAAPPGIPDVGPQDYALEGCFKLSLLPDRPAGAVHPFRFEGRDGEIALRPHDGCGFIKASLAGRMPAIARARHDAPEQLRAFGDKSALPPSALQHYPGSVEVAEEAREKVLAWLKPDQSLSAEKLYRTVTGGRIEGSSAIAVPSSDECLHVPTGKSTTLTGEAGVLVGRSPYDKPNLRPFGADRVRSARDGDRTAAFLDQCVAFQYSFNVAHRSGTELAADDPTFFAKGILIVVPDDMWPADFIERSVVMSAEDVKCHSRWLEKKDRVRADTALDCVGILQATEVYPPGSLVAVPTAEQKKLDGDFDGDAVVIIGDRPRLYEHVRQFDTQLQARGIASMKPPKSHTPAIENGSYQFSRSKQILSATGLVLETYSTLQLNFLAQPLEAQRQFAKRAIFGTYEGIHPELKADICALLQEDRPDGQTLQELIAGAGEDSKAAKHPVARELAALLVAELQDWNLQLNSDPAHEQSDVKQQLAQSAASTGPKPAISAEASALFSALSKSYAESPDAKKRIASLLDHYKPRIDPRPDGYNPDDLHESVINLLSVGIKVGTDAYKSDTGARVFMEKTGKLQGLLEGRPGFKSAPYVKAQAAKLHQGRFDVDRSLADLQDNPTLAGSVMEASIGVAVEMDILRGVARQQDRVARSPKAGQILAALGTRPVVLVGMPASGKSTIGPQLAKELGVEFVDTDKRIVAEHGDLRKMFDDPGRGETHFRDLEAKELAKHLERGPIVIATGGGCFTKKFNRDLILNKARSIWLDTDIKELKKRLKRDTSRPLLQGPDIEQKVDQMYEERSPFYQQADFRLPLVPPLKDKKVAGICVGKLYDLLCSNREAALPSHISGASGTATSMSPTAQRMRDDHPNRGEGVVETIQAPAAPLSEAERPPPLDTLTAAPQPLLAGSNARADLVSSTRSRQRSSRGR